jgi:hypothetical protein
MDSESSLRATTALLYEASRFAWQRVKPSTSCEILGCN